MNNARFTMNAFLIVLIIFSAIGLFVTVKLYGMAGNMHYLSDDYAVEGTDLTIHYGTQEENGIYEGKGPAAKLKLEGRFGHEWGLALEGDQLFLNEYDATAVGMTLCSLVQVDTNTFTRKTLAEHTILRGKCASGELVCLTGCLLPSNYPDKNSLCRLYLMTWEPLNRNRGGATVLYIDPKTGSEVWRVRDPAALAPSFDKIYLAHTLDEIRNRESITGGAEDGEVQR